MEKTKKLIAYYNPRIKPTPLDDIDNCINIVTFSMQFSICPTAKQHNKIHAVVHNVDGMWITRAEPHRVMKIWATDSERPKLVEEPEYIQAMSSFMARYVYDFEPIKELKR